MGYDLVGFLSFVEVRTCTCGLRERALLLFQRDAVPRDSAGIGCLLLWVGVEPDVCKPWCEEGDPWG